MNYNFNQLRVTFFMCKMFYWYLQGILLMGPILQLKLHHMRDKFCHIWDGFSLVCYLLIDKRYLRMIYVPKLLKKNQKMLYIKKCYTDLMPHVSWSMVHLLEYVQVFMSCTLMSYLLIPFGETGLFNPLRSYT